jgi:anhydro-N-acetylmuramic acid kinase
MVVLCNYMDSSKRLSSVLNKKSRRIIGLMSGMSMDGIDLACADISGDFPNLKVELIGTFYRPYANDFKLRLKSGVDSKISEISQLNVLVSNEFSQCVDNFLTETGIQRASIDCIGSHGQTLYHSTEDPIHSTLQIGSPSIIAELTGIITIGNFRARDIAGGGRGAPLVSMADYVFYRGEGPVALNNLGSISNVTVVTPKIEDMLAFDTGPANMPIDYFAKGVDLGGEFSSKGKVIQELLAELCRLDFFKQLPPKAAGYGEFGPEVLAKISFPYLNSRQEDLVRTAVEFSALTLANSYRSFVLPRYPTLKKAIFSGGGIYNLTLMNRIKALLPEIQIEVLNNNLADSKEALSFAILANETLSGRPGSLPAITGVLKPTILGELAF